MAEPDYSYARQAKFWKKLYNDTCSEDFKVGTAGKVLQNLGLGHDVVKQVYKWYYQEIGDNLLYNQQKRVICTRLYKKLITDGLISGGVGGSGIGRCSCGCP